MSDTGLVLLNILDRKITYIGHPKNKRVITRNLRKRKSKTIFFPQKLIHYIPKFIFHICLNVQEDILKIRILKVKVGPILTF
jgi:hypothetical protein